MNSAVDLTGRRFGRLSVICCAGRNRHGHRLWNCRCDCGAQVITTSSQLSGEKTRSCGCLDRERRVKHGHHRSRTYGIWRAMLNRCHLSQHRKYYAHVAVCERWRKFENFLSDMGEVPAGLTLDRRDNSRGYEPGNCRWATRTQQARNTRRRVDYEHQGERRSLIEWAEHLGLSHDMLRGRVRRGWSFADAIAK